MWGALQDQGFQLAYDDAGDIREPDWRITSRLLRNYCQIATFFYFFFLLGSHDLSSLLPLFFSTKETFVGFLQRLSWDSGLQVTWGYCGTDSGPNCLWCWRSSAQHYLTSCNQCFFYFKFSRENQMVTMQIIVWLRLSQIFLWSSELWQRCVRLHSCLHHQLGPWVLIFWWAEKGQGKLSNIHAAFWFSPDITLELYS